MRLFFVRHGESTANVQHVFSNAGYRHPLTEKGIEQAHALARSLSGIPVEQIYSSPVMRAVQTAEILSEALDAPVEISEALREWSVGDYEGTTDPAGWALHSQVMDDWSYHQKFDSRMPGGESWDEVRARFMPFMDGLLRKEGSPGRTLVLVSHGGLYLAMLPALFKNVSVAMARQYGFPNTGYAAAETRSDGLTCTSWCGFPIEAI